MSAGAINFRTWVAGGGTPEQRAQWEAEHAARWRTAREAEERERAVKNAAERERLEAAKIAAWRQRVQAVVPVLDVDELFVEPVESQALTAARKWHDAPQGHGLVLRGGCGVGKTFALAKIVCWWLEPKIIETTGGWLAYSPPPDISWLRPDELVSAVLHAYDAKAPKLHRHIVIDDIGRETKADFTEALCRVLETRVANDRWNPGPHVVIGSTNCSKAEMRQRYDLRLLERLNERCIAVDVRGPSLRPQSGF